MVAYVLVVERQSVASIGWRIDGPLSFVLQTLAGTVLLLGSNALIEPVLSRFGWGADDDLEAGLASFADYSVPERLFVAATAGVTEEVPYRGYAIERVATLTGSSLLGGAVSLAAFVAVHVGDTWTPRAALRIAVPAGLIVAVYLWTRSLPVVIAVHVLNDAVGLLLVDRYVEEESASDPTTADT